MLLAGWKLITETCPAPWPADLCLESEHNHKNILHTAYLHVNDRNQVRKVLIVLDDLSDNQYNEM
jgi:hypothetical protein